MSTATQNNPFAMKATAGGGGDFETCPAGNHAGRMIAIIDLGTQRDVYQGQVSESRKVLLTFECSGEMKRDGTPFLIQQAYALYFSSKSKLRALVEGWFNKAFSEGQEFDIAKLLGRECLINVVHKTTKKGNAIAVLGGISAPPKGMTVPRQVNPSLQYVVGDGPLPADATEHYPFLYDNEAGRMVAVVDIIAKCKELNGGPAMAGEDVPRPADDDDDLPF